jgi:hypothetical protein
VRWPGRQNVPAPAAHAGAPWAHVAPAAAPPCALSPRSTLLAHAHQQGVLLLPKQLCLCWRSSLQQCSASRRLPLWPHKATTPVSRQRPSWCGPRGIAPYTERAGRAGPTCRRPRGRHRRWRRRRRASRPRRRWQRRRRRTPPRPPFACRRPDQTPAHGAAHHRGKQRALRVIVRPAALLPDQPDQEAPRRADGAGPATDMTKARHRMQGQRNSTLPAAPGGAPEPAAPPATGPRPLGC